MELDNTILKLINERLIRSSSSKDEKILNDWIQSSKSNKEHYKKILNLICLSKDAVSINEIDEAKAWYIVDSRINATSKPKLIKFNIFRYAAAILLPIIMAVSVYYFVNISNKNSDEAVYAFLHSLKPGTQKGTLTLSNGEKIKLGSQSSNKILFKNDAVEIKDSSNIIVYKRKAGTITGVQKDRVHVPIGGEYVAILSDGTKVWLNSGSDFEFPIQFTGSKRIVSLSGEAFLKVKEDKSRPFIVKTKGVDIRVLGTSFNVSAYQDDDRITTTLLEGSISIKSAIEEIIMSPGDQTEYFQNKLHSKKVNAKLYSEWKDGVFKFKDTRLQDITKKLSRWYNVDFFFDNNKLKNLKFNGSVNKNKPITAIMDILKETNHITYEVSKKAILIKEKKKK